MAERPLYPRRLCFLNDKSDPDSGIALYDVDNWISKYNIVEHDMQYVFVSYTTTQFSHRDPEDIERLHNIAKQAAIDAGVGAYWIGASCMSDNKEELEEDVFRISDVIRAAHSVVIAIKPSSNDAGAAERLLKDWGMRMWTFPEALLSPNERPLRIYSHSYGTVKLVKEVDKKNLGLLIWDDLFTTRQLIDHYEGNLTLSRLELVILALGCLSNRWRSGSETSVGATEPALRASRSARVHSGTLGGRFFELPASVGPPAKAAPAPVAALSSKRRRVGRLAGSSSMVFYTMRRDERPTRRAHRETIFWEGAAMRNER